MMHQMIYLSDCYAAIGTGCKGMHEVSDS